jgi:hypothetical protein
MSYHIHKNDICKTCRDLQKFSFIQEKHKFSDERAKPTSHKNWSSRFSLALDVIAISNMEELL